ncbi:MAG: methyltransferase domain-containing protein [Patescibacteria group bacterium]
MERLLNLEELGRRLATTDVLIMQLIKRRMELAEQVGKFKRQKDEPIFRAEIEDRRIQTIRDWATEHGLNPHFAELILYALINESCKLQMIQLQQEKLEGEVQSEDEWYLQLKRNLLTLTERWCATYDSDYESSFFATKAYLAFERKLLEVEVGKLQDHSCMLDLGCATGSVSFTLERFFERVVGLDISQHMQSWANNIAEQRGVQDRVSFECADLEDGIPLPDGSVSFVAMTLGTGGDVRDIRKVIDETVRVLKPGGRCFFSFYNREALVYRWEFLPWEIGLAATVNTHRDSLDVHSRSTEKKDEVIPIFARAYTREEVTDLFRRSGLAVSLQTYPAVSAILPHELCSQLEVQEAVLAIDAGLVDSSMGAYIIVIGEKPI